MSMSNFQAIVNVEKNWSARNDESYYTVEMIDYDSGVIRITYVSESNFNYKPWFQAAELFMRHPTHAVIISSEKFKTKKKKSSSGYEIINADSSIEYEGAVKLGEFMESLADTLGL